MSEGSAVVQEVPERLLAVKYHVDAHENQLVLDVFVRDVLTFRLLAAAFVSHRRCKVDDEALTQ